MPTVGPDKPLFAHARQGLLVALTVPTAILNWRRSRAMREMGFSQGVRELLQVSSYDESEILWAHSHICSEYLNHIITRCSLFYGDLLGVIDVIKDCKLSSSSIKRHLSVAVCTTILQISYSEIKIIDEANGGKRCRWWVSPHQGCSQICFRAWQNLQVNLNILTMFQSHLFVYKDLFSF